MAWNAAKRVNVFFRLLFEHIGYVVKGNDPDEAVVGVDDRSSDPVVPLKEARNFLLVLERSDALTWLSLRNAPEVHIVAVDQLNTYDVLAADDLVFTQGAYEAFVGGEATGATVAETIEIETNEKAAAPAALADVKTAKSAAKAAKSAAAAAKRTADTQTTRAQWILSVI